MGPVGHPDLAVTTDPLPAQGALAVEPSSRGRGHCSSIAENRFQEAGRRLLVVSLRGTVLAARTRNRILVGLDFTRPSGSGPTGLAVLGQPP
jgi:hypothetical protein